MTQASDRITEFEILPTDDVTAVAADRLELLRMLEAGNGYREIAATKSLAIGTVKSRINRTRKKILARRETATSSVGGGT